MQTTNLPVALNCLVPDVWHRSMYLGAADGRIFEVPMNEEHDDKSRATIPDNLAEAGIEILAGHSRAVNSLGTSTSGYELVSGNAIPKMMTLS